MISPLGRGFELLTLKNWSRCKSTSSATKAFTGMTKLRFSHFASAIALCCPSTIHAGLRPPVDETGISIVPDFANPSSVDGPRLCLNLTLEDRARMMEFGKMIES